VRTGDAVRASWKETMAKKLAEQALAELEARRSGG
jgi:hypothetical protein